MSARPRIALLLLAAATAAVLLLPSGAAAIPAGKIKGTVVDASLEGVEEVEVCALDPVELEPVVSCVETDSNGEYEIVALPDGKYVVEFWAPYFGYVTQFFDGAWSPEAATEVTISAGSTASGIDAEMEAGGRIEGSVTVAATGAGIAGAEVCAFSEFGSRCTNTNGAGHYTLVEAPTGSYVVGFSAAGYPVRYYNEKTTFGAADQVSVAAPNATTGIDARMGEPAPPAALPTTPSLPSLPAAPVHKHKHKLRCKKGFKKAKRHGRKVCVRKHRKRRHKRRHR